MKQFNARTITIAALIAGVASLSACSSDQVIDNTVGVVAGGTKMAAKGAVGAGRMVYRGVTRDSKD